MSKRVIVLGVLLTFAGYASAIIVEFSDAELLTITVGGTEDSTLDLVTDIPGDPGVQFDFTFASGSGWKDIALAKYNPVIAPGDTWTAMVKNVSADGKYITVYPFFQVDTWVYHQGTGFNVAFGDTVTIAMVNPAVTTTSAVGIKVGTNDWINRVDGGSASIQVIPEPATLALLGLGGLAALRRRK